VRRVTLVLEYFHPWPNSAGFYFARSRGWFADAGLDLEIRTVDPGRGDTLDYLAREEAHFGVFPSNRLLVRRERGECLLGVAAVNQRGLETLRVLASSGIERLRDLEGKRIAYNPTPRGHAIVRSLIASDGGDPDNYIPVDAGARELDPATGFGGLADATYGSYWAWDNLLTSLPPSQERVWRVDEALGLEYHSYLLGLREHLATDDPGLVSTFLAVAERGFVAAAAEQEEAAGVFERVTPYFPTAVIRRSLEEVAPTWFHEGRWGVIREELLAPYAGWMVEHGILSDGGIWRGAVTARHVTPGVA
jgi:NitT/TauT family transport system substrate-binding protein